MENIHSFAERCLSISRTLFKQLARKFHVVHDLLPAKRDTELTRHIILTKKYPTVCANVNFLIEAKPHIQARSVMYAY